MKKRIYGAVLFLSLFQILFINVGPYLNLSPSLRSFQYRLWAVHTPWLFFTSRVLQKETPLVIDAGCVFQTCSQIGDFRFKSLMLLHAIESMQKVQVVESGLCPFTSGPEIRFHMNHEERSVTCQH
jgi:hypothetical protein